MPNDKGMTNGKIQMTNDKGMSNDKIQMSKTRL